jgi:hypothetical protein
MRDFTGEMLKLIEGFNAVPTDTKFSALAYTIFCFIVSLKDDEERERITTKVLAHFERTAKMGEGTEV